MIISLLAILMLLCDETIEENEIEWFFQNGGNKGNNDNRFEKQFLGWKMGCASGTSAKDNTKKKASEPNEESQNELTYYSLSDQSIKTSPGWKTFVLNDSTIRYIPLEEMVTVKTSINSLIPDDALDPFYLDTDLQADIFNHELFNTQYAHKVPTQIPQHQLFQNPNIYPKKNSKSSKMFCPVRLSFQKKIMPLLDPYGRVAQHHMSYYRKPKTEPGLLPEMSRRTMFLHPRLLDMMKAMDRSILSYPSKFDYKSLDQIRYGHRHLPPNRYYDRIVV